MARRMFFDSDIRFTWCGKLCLDGVGSEGRRL